jgi:hypothetical protein
MSQKTQEIPGIVRPLKDYRGWRNKGTHHARSIEAKREAVIRGIERSLRGEKGGAKLEHYDPDSRTTVIRVPYAALSLPIFDGEPFAAIDDRCDRGTLWGAIIERIRSGAHDREIQEAATLLSQSMKKKTTLKAV